MPDTSPNLALPYLLPAQAQKHVTHNEALARLDRIVQLVVQGFGALTPPASPQPGEIHALGAAPGGDWAGQANRLAAWDGGAWTFIAPREGWCAWGRAEGELRIWRGAGWDRLPLANLPGLGVGTTHDTVNRLAVAAPATLLTHAGAGHQLKINKATATDTASLLFQDGWSGRAEMGLTGGDDFSVKVSADGALWSEALAADRATGRVRLPAGGALPAGTAASPALSRMSEAGTGLFFPAVGEIGFAANGTERLRLTAAGVLTGTAVVQSATDTTAGRVVTAGWMGLGALAVPDVDANAAGLATRVVRFLAANSPDAASSWHGLHISRVQDAQGAQIALRDTTATGAALMAVRQRDSTGVWAAWNVLYGRRNALGAVSQASGVPTGALIERGSNANGDYIRFADGSQICWLDAAYNATLAAGANTGDQTWTFPAAFATGSTPALRATPRATSTTADRLAAALGLRACGTPSGAGSATYVLANAGGAAMTARADLLAIGRWF